MTARPLDLHAAPFADDFIDVAELNAHVSDHLIARLKRVRGETLDGARVPSSAVVVLGPAGGGKTHLLGRVRHLAGPNATLVLLRPYFGVSLTLRDVLAATIDQLCRPTKGSVLAPIDLLVAHWLTPESGSLFPSASALETRTLTSAERSARIEDAVARVLARVPELAPVAHFVRAFLSMGSHERSDAWSELAWLSGREPRTLDKEGAGVLGERDLLHVLTLVAALAAPIAPLLLIFDQLENLATEGDERVLGFGNLLSELVDTVPGLTILQLALTSEWLQFIEPRLSLSQRTRLANDKQVLELPNEEERRALLRAWQERLVPSSTKVKKDRFAYPLSKAQLSELLSAPGVTPRMLASAYSRVLAGKPMTEPPLPSSDAPSTPQLQTLFDAERAHVESELTRKEEANLPLDATELAEALSSALSFAPRLELETRLERERVITHVRAPGGELAVVYLTSSHHSSVAAGLARAIELARLGKVAVVREKRLQLPQSWITVHERRAAFERLPNARWLWLDREDTVRCLSLARISSLARSKRLRSSTSDEPFSLDWVHSRAASELSPAEWAAPLSITRWLSDIPREARDAKAPEPTPQARDAPPKADPTAATPSLREWLAMGRGIGRAAIGSYVARLRRRF